MPSLLCLIAHPDDETMLCGGTLALLAAKGVDLLVVNDVSRRDIGFEADDNQVVLIDRWGGERALPRMPKSDVADAILTHVLALRLAAAAERGDRVKR